MQIENFWQHWQIKEDPFRAEEARDDPVFMQLVAKNIPHPYFDKVYGQPDQPSTAVVFGEKGSGKTALRLLVEQSLERHNQEHPDRRVWIVRYDDWNPILNRFAHAVGAKKQDSLETLKKFTLTDHQDAILSLTVTRLVDAALGESKGEIPADQIQQRLREMPRARRVDLAILAALYDQPRTGHFMPRWWRLRRILRLGRLPMVSMAKWGGIVAAVAAAMLYLVHPLLTGVLGALAVLMLGFWAWRTLGLWSLSRKIAKQLRTVERKKGELRKILARIPSKELRAEPLAVPRTEDSRFQLTGRLLDLLEEFGYRGLVVLVDGVDEPAMVNGDAQRMRAIIWPMLNNSFLQQDRVGIKLMLPLELRHLLRREDQMFYQHARLDKHHMIDRLVWNGTTLYDLCNRRLQACRAEDAREPIALPDLFDDEVNRQDLIDALDQMQQPRDAFKFLYQTVQEHCSNTPDEAPVYRIPRLTLEGVRKQQSQRVQELYRGLSPA